MRLWSIHPKYLDPQGLVALWREALLAQKVIAGKTRGYRFHPQLERFREYKDPLRAIGAYLSGVADEAQRRGYRFDRGKILKAARSRWGKVSSGQIKYESDHLKKKLRARSPAFLKRLPGSGRLQSHPCFQLVRGPVAAWERPKGTDLHWKPLFTLKWVARARH